MARFQEFCTLVPHALRLVATTIFVCLKKLLAISPLPPSIGHAKNTASSFINFELLPKPVKHEVLHFQPTF